jgi:septal ring factor EnvC (AmiA/AmiB activator)
MEKIEMLNDCERERDLTDDIKKKKKLEIDISSLKQEINEISYEIEDFKKALPLLIAILDKLLRLQC